MKNKILIVDDQDMILMLFKRFFEILEVDFELTNNCSKALEIISNSPDDYSLAIVDLKMPDCEGSDLAAMIKKASPGIKIILSSGAELNTDGYRELISQGVIDGTLNKPFTMENIRLLVEKSSTGQL